MIFGLWPLAFGLWSLVFGLPSLNRVLISKAKDQRPYFLELTRCHRLPWQFLIAHRGIVNKCRHDGRCLLHIISLNAIKHILVGVMGTCVVFNLILNELETRQPNSVKRQMIRASSVGDRKSRRTPWLFILWSVAKRH